jgi:hypothetical protein
VSSAPASAVVVANATQRPLPESAYSLVEPVVPGVASSVVPAATSRT